MILTELCQDLRNWFDRGQDKWHGEIVISNGEIVFDGLSLQPNQYYRIIGSLFNDGVHKYQDENDELTDETFSGSVWSMAVPPAVIALCKDIEDWQAKYGGVDGAVMSPYSSESFGGYSYSKGSSGSANGSSAAVTWQSMFASRLNKWRKI